MLCGGSDPFPVFESPTSACAERLDRRDAPVRLGVEAFVFAAPLLTWNAWLRMVLFINHFQDG